MTVVRIHQVPSLRQRVSDDEWQARVDLAAAYRLVAHYGWTHLINNHISLRVPGTEDQFLINPYGSSTSRSPPQTWSRSMSTATSSTRRLIR